LQGASGLTDLGIGSLCQRLAQLLLHSNQLPLGFFLCLTDEQQVGANRWDHLTME
jgi:hypothetical protein